MRRCRTSSTRSTILSSEGEAEFRIHEATNEEAEEELNHLGIWGDMEQGDDEVMVVHGDVPEERLRAFANAVAAAHGATVEDRQNEDDHHDPIESEEEESANTSPMPDESGNSVSRSEMD